MLVEGPILDESRILPERALPQDAREEGALIGPNAVLQLADVMRERLDTSTYEAIMRDAQIEELPSGDAMIPEAWAMSLHRWLAIHAPETCIEMAREAGKRTADYILAHRIPAFARAVLRVLPARLASGMLMKAIRAHAWTFIGSGTFAPKNAWDFTIDRSQADDALMPSDSIFEWYAAVFERLYRCLVHNKARCRDRGGDLLHPLDHHYAIWLDTAH